jgi:hypothetical protein
MWDVLEQGNKQALAFIAKNIKLALIVIAVMI